jgi:hypothetical protein
MMSLNNAGSEWESGSVTPATRACRYAPSWNTDKGLSAGARKG